MVLDMIFPCKIREMIKSIFTVDQVPEVNYQIVVDLMGIPDMDCTFNNSTMKLEPLFLDRCIDVNCTIQECDKLNNTKSQRN